MAWLQVILLIVLSMTAAACELAGDIFEAGAWVGGIIVILVIAIVGFLIAKVRG